MRKLLIILLISFFLTSFTKREPVNNPNSSVLVFKNNSSNKTITSFTIVCTQFGHNPSTRTVSTNIGPGQTYTYSFGHVENIYLTLNFTSSSHASMKIVDINDPDYCPWLVCSSSSSTTSSLTAYFYQYTPRYIFFNAYSGCVC